MLTCVADTLPCREPLASPSPPEAGHLLASCTSGGAGSPFPGTACTGWGPLSGRPAIPWTSQPLTFSGEGVQVEGLEAEVEDLNRYDHALE